MKTNLYSDPPISLIYLLSFTFIALPHLIAHPFESHSSCDVPNLEKILQDSSSRSNFFVDKGSENSLQEFTDRIQIKKKLKEAPGEKKNMPIKMIFPETDGLDSHTYNKSLPKDKLLNKELTSTDRATFVDKGKAPIESIEHIEGQGIKAKSAVFIDMLNQDSERPSQKPMGQHSVKNNPMQEPTINQNINFKILFAGKTLPKAKSNLDAGQRRKKLLPSSDVIHGDQKLKKKKENHVNILGGHGKRKALLERLENIETLDLPATPPDVWQPSQAKHPKLDNVPENKEGKLPSNIVIQTCKPSQSRYKVEKKDDDVSLTVEQPMVVRVLQRQFRLALAQIPHLYGEIEAAFREFRKSALSRIPSGNGENYHQEDIVLALEKIRTQLVMVVLGSVDMLYQNKHFLPSMDALLDDAWTYLLGYLKYEIIENPQIYDCKEGPVKLRKTFQDNGGLFKNTLRLSKRSFVSSRISFYRLQEWASSSKYATSLSIVSLNYSSFLNTCEIFCKNRGQGKLFYIKDKSNNSKLSDVQERHYIKIGNLKKYSSYKLNKMWTSGFPKLMKENGNKLITQGMKSSEISRFFSDLKIEISEIFKEHRNKTNALVLETQTILTPEIVYKAIEAAQSKITPGFLGLLGMIHPEREHHLIKWDEIYQDGWEFMRDYFSSWTNFLSKNDHPIIIETKLSKNCEIEWSNFKEMIYYLNKIQSAWQVPQRPFWYFVDLWLESNTNHFDVLPPNRKIIKEDYFRMISREGDHIIKQN